MGIASIKSGTRSKAKRSTNDVAKGVVVTKTARGFSVTDNGVVRMKFKVISKAELKGYQHPLYKPLIP